MCSRSRPHDIHSEWRYPLPGLCLCYLFSAVCCLLSLLSAVSAVSAVCCLLSLLSLLHRPVHPLFLPGQDAWGVDHGDTLQHRGLHYGALEPGQGGEDHEGEEVETKTVDGGDDDDDDNVLSGRRDA